MSRSSMRIATLLMGLALASCGQVEPVILSVSMPDCTYRGPSAFTEGSVRLSLTLNGLGTARALLVELADDHTYADLEAHLEKSDDWEIRPDWLRPVIDLELSDAEGLDGVAESRSLDEGDYAVVCVDQDTGIARAASSLEVSGS